MDFTYKIHLIDPTSPQLSYLAGRFASLRLSALISSPTSFATKFSTESTLNFSDWITRISRPNVRIFICVAYPVSTPTSAQTIENGAWVGKATLLGPTPKSDFELPLSGREGELRDDDQDGKWQMTALYIDPAHRGRGLSKKVVERALEFARRVSQDEGKSATLRIFANPANDVVKALYGGLGFVDAGLCTLKEAYIQNGDRALIPADGGVSDPEMWNTRFGLVMERTVEI